MDNWLPMDTAPKDGTVILLHIDNGKLLAAHYNIQNRAGWEQDASYGTWDTEVFDDWRPLDPMPVEVCAPPKCTIVATINGVSLRVLSYELDCYCPRSRKARVWDGDTLSDRTQEDEDSDFPVELETHITHWMLALTPEV